MPIPRIMRREKSFPHIKEIPEKIVIRHSNQSRKQPHEYAHEIQTGINQLQFPYLPFAQIAPLRRFEQTGEISLKGLLQIGFALNALSEFDALFVQKQYQSLDDVLNEQNVIRKRGKKNE